MSCLHCCLLVGNQQLVGPGHSRYREVVVELAGSVVAGQLQPSAASLGNHCSRDDDKYQ